MGDTTAAMGEERRASGGEERLGAERQAARERAACCDAAEPATCCTPAAKASCCGTPAADDAAPTGGCGCR